MTSNGSPPHAFRRRRGDAETNWPCCLKRRLQPQGREGMSQLFDRLQFFRKYVDRFSNGFGVVTEENRAWEDSYRQRWQHDKIVRSTHGTNCTGSCSWKIYVKN